MPTVHTVAPGECVSSIAFQYGFFPDTLWQHADNSALRAKRANPHALLPGDEVRVPDLRVSQQACGDSAKHRFRRKGVPAKLKLRLLKDDQPLANKKYDFEAGAIRKSGTTDGDGALEVPIPPNEPTGILRVGEGADLQVYELAFGHIDPLDTDSGVESRLRNLGYSFEEGLEGAVKAFQEKQNLPANGTIDAATRDKLKSAYGH